ncbi:MAG: TIGR00730 family Rossman fold protein [Candidatus Marinimicrobia bacterium]|nr:TIGR00730 family Rossman fold protein [Candidatus Neomarinimicrobiota bacterium]MBL7010679.1 TIGR00730 family Rossman fold protein [Candidatus Neomarinimicrobiota bacterium]MBL7031136.1 TIGR00730 family Rossman fold protein [Candidatus Neomarinimicrobiota bacterium]
MSKENNDRFYYNKEFLGSPDARSVRLLSEYYGPLQRFRRNKIQDTIVFFGSARLKSQEEAMSALANAPKNISHDDQNDLETDLDMSRYYEAARELAFKMTQWSKKLNNKKKRFIITSGGGPGIMEAANRGASEAKGLAVGLSISLPHEQAGNQWISDDLEINFHYFFMRKFWFLYLAKAMVVWPGGFGTLDEVMEVLTLIQTNKLRKQIPIVLFDSDFWNHVVNWDFLAEKGVISKSDLDLFQICDTVDEAYKYLTKKITATHLRGPNF